MNLSTLSLIALLSLLFHFPESEEIINKSSDNFGPQNNTTVMAACTVPGSINSGSSTTLDPNADGYFSVYNGSGYTVSNNEFTEFEDLNGIGGANKGWTPLTGDDPDSDVLSSGSCGNTDIVTDGDGGSDYAYYSIVDPDGTADNGDEYLVFAVRIADRVTGAFGFSFLMDSDNNCVSSDPNAVCGNPCFEYEVQLSTNTGNVSLFNIDGCAGTSNCDATHTPDAAICDPCNSEALQVCAGSGPASCSGDPVLWVFYIDFSDIPGVNSSSDFALTPATTTSGNEVIYKGTNVSDYGGINDLSELGGGSCDCSTFCSGSGCANCEKDCLLSCASVANTIYALPVDFLSVNGDYIDGKAVIEWTVDESYAHDGYWIEKADENLNYQTVGKIEQYTMEGKQTYSFTDNMPSGELNYYRIIQRDFDGSSSYSSVIKVNIGHLSPYLVSEKAGATLTLKNLKPGLADIQILNMNGQMVIETKKVEGVKELRLNLTGLSEGIYVLKVKEAGQVYFLRKLVLP